MRTFLLLSSVVLLGACGQQPRCTSTSQCANQQLCAPSGICLNTCQAHTQCGAGQTCSSAGACVSPTTGCAVSADCASGQICAPGGICMAMSAADAGPSTCGGQKFESTPTEANVLIVLDHSGSMQETISNNRSKWDTATEAVRSLTAQNANSRLRFGLQLFSLAGAQCQPGQVVVNVGPSNVTAISNALPATANGSGTPLGAALRVASRSNDIADPTRANFVLLLTDGMENCNGAPVAEVEGLFSRGVRTYTVGFGSDVDANMLNQLSIKGGTARATSPRYFQADSPAELEVALRAIASGAASCDFTLTQTPPNPASLYVAVDGQFFPRDPSRVAGWDYQAQGNRVTLYGPACDIVSQRPGAKVTVVYGCPDESLTEIGPGGTLDAGLPGFPGDGGIPEIN